jgi:hypothetical protein
MLRASLICMGKKWFVKLGQENLVRVKNFPLQYKTLTGRQVPDQTLWDAKLEKIVRRRIGSKGKPGSLPGWYKRGEIEGGTSGGSGNLIDWKSSCVGDSTS